MTSENASPPVRHVENEKPVFDAPGVGELQDVDEQAADAAAEHVGTDARQSDGDHPYDADADPDSDYTRREREDSQLGKVVASGDGMSYDRSPVERSNDDRFADLRAAGKDAMALDPGLPAAAPRAGG